MRTGSITLAVALATLSTSASAFVLTPMEVFANCTAAKEFRDKDLPKKLDAEFERYRKGVQKRTDNIMKEFSASVKSSQVDYAKYTEAQRKEVLIAAGKFLYGLSIEHFVKDLKVAKASFDQLSEANKKLVAAIGAKTDGLGELTFDAVRGKKIDVGDVVQPYADGLLALLTYSWGPASKMIVDGAKGAIDIGAAYAEHKPDRDFAQQQTIYWKKSLENLVVNSPDFRTRLINDTKNAIDKACGA